MRVDDTSLWTTTDAAGQFRIEPAPVGDVLLIVDGSTTERSGVWAEPGAPDDHRGRAC